MKLMMRTPKKKNDKVDFDNDVDIKLDSKGPIQCTRMFCAFAYNLYQPEALYDVDAGIGDH